MKSRFEAVNGYFNGWVSGNKEQILATLADTIYIEECYGPCYRGKEQVAVWLERWFAKGTVDSWVITDEWFAEVEQTYFCKWAFTCTYKGNTDSFSGVSKVTFADNKIATLEEFQSTLTHKYPFGE
ncbi:nuclear transport factor 2 family protein [Culicoidibacter larvae]|uniref:Nuclear transport factor 2 family protein n=1 Tax=Culicoidibacter larvae TaxID=2579976 RepID=A0A5R8QFF6_9FIRM|nr:nuclear transport factor 2 family protein [Culicoidibacter larvae]TLG76769.1 nuclear transport factor 2 family protein [Culicoidibacter larvae]